MRRWVGCALILAGFVPAAARADQVGLGTAGGYGEFILGNSTRSNVDAQGKVAVGGNADFNNFTVASKQATGSGVNLVVGGDLKQVSASTNGSVVVGGATTYQTPTIRGDFHGNGAIEFDKSYSGGRIDGDVTYGSTFKNGNPQSWNFGVTIGGHVTSGVTTPLPIDFQAEASFLQATSLAQVSSLDPSLQVIPNSNWWETPGSFYSRYGQIFVNEAQTGDYYLNLTGDQLQAATGGLNINAAAGSTVVFNVSGSGFTIPNTGFNLSGGITVDHLLFNFYEATDLTIQGSIKGTVLAPLATVHTSYGSLDGGLIAQNVSGSIETHIYNGGSGGNTLFVGNLRPGASAVPEPASLAMLIAGGMGVGLRLRCARKA